MDTDHKTKQKTPPKKPNKKTQSKANKTSKQKTLHNQWLVSVPFPPGGGYSVDSLVRLLS